MRINRSKSLTVTRSTLKGIINRNKEFMASLNGFLLALKKRNLSLQRFFHCVRMIPLVRRWGNTVTSPVGEYSK